MTRPPILLLTLALLLPAARLAAADATAEITTVLAAQQDAWNRGDLDGFMAGYERADDLRFASGGNVTYGWQPTLEHYRQHYPGRAAMGTLAFSNLAITVLAPDAAIAFGRWELARAAGKVSGLFTLTLRKNPAGWHIIQDHTSLAEK